jgi:hypothetical protein
MWFAGIDWANAHHDIVIIDETGRQVGSRRVAHSPQGLNDLMTFLESIIGSEKDQVVCIIETNHGLLITALVEAGSCISRQSQDRRSPESCIGSQD